MLEAAYSSVSVEKKELFTEANLRKVIEDYEATLFESMMIANTKKTMEAAVTEGIEVEKEDAMNAALIESLHTPHSSNSLHADSYSIKSGLICSRMDVDSTKRAKVWKDSRGTVICSAILYTETNISPGISISNGSADPSINIHTIKHYAYDVNPKYKKDALYLASHFLD